MVYSLKNHVNSKFFLLKGQIILDLNRSFAFHLNLPKDSQGFYHPKLSDVDSGSLSSKALCLATESKDELLTWLNIFNNCAKSQEHVK